MKHTSEQLAWLIRRHGVEMTHLSGGSHLGAILSVADIVATLYTDVMHYDPKNPKWEGRDRFILSKGHAGALSHHLPGVDFSTGSLGHGLGAAAGIAYALKKDSRIERSFVVLGDGECNEGSVWEAALFANHFRLNNLCAIVDHNHMQSLDFNENTLEIEDFASKWKAFGWNVIEINGNNLQELKAAFKQFDENTGTEPHKPTVIIANTIKGYGIPFMQNDILWHYRFPHDGWEYDTAVTELHKIKPAGCMDPYTPNGIENPVAPTENDDVYNDHTFSYTWKTSYPEKMRRVDAKIGTTEKVHNV